MGSPVRKMLGLERRSLTFQSIWGRGDDVFGRRTLAGVNVDETTAMQNMAVWRAVNLTASTVAALPLKCYSNGKDGRSEKTQTLFMDPIYPDMTWLEFVEQQVTSILLWGNAYAFKIKNEGGDKIVRILPVNPNGVTVRRGPATLDNPSGKMFDLPGMAVPLTPNEIMHTPGLSYDGVCGLSPVAHARQAIGTAIAAEAVAAHMFDSGLLVGGFLQAESNDITKQQADEAKRRWREKVSGPAKAYEVAVLSAGLKFVPTQLPPQDAQWLETRKFSVEEIARMFGVPADLLFENSATGNTNAEARALSWVKFGLSSLLSRMEDRFSMHLLPRGQFCEFDLGGLLRGDSLTQAQVHEIALGAHGAKPWMTPNEIRALHNLRPLEGGDVLLPPSPETPPPAPPAA